MRRSAWIVGLAVGFCWITPAEPAGTEVPSKKPLAVEDLYRLDAPRSVVLAPDRRLAAYVRAWIDPSTKRERFSLWSCDGDRDRARALEKDEPDARSPVFSPDGNRIAFLSTRDRPKGWKQTRAVPEESDPATDVWLIPAKGGPAIPLAGPEKSYGRVFNDGFYGRVAFSLDGRRLAFVADDGKDSRTPEELDADVEVVRPDQGEGYTGYRPAQIWVAELDPSPDSHAAIRIHRLTDDDVWYGDPQWSPDGRMLAVHANKTSDRESVRYSINKDFDIYAIDVTTRVQRALARGGHEPEVSPRFSPDGTKLACLSIPRKGSHRDVFNLKIVTLGADDPRSEIVHDHHALNAEPAPHPAPVFPLPDDCWDGNDRLVYHAETGTTSATIRIDLSARKGDRLELPDVAAAIDLATVAGRINRRQQLTPPGNRFLDDRLLGETRVVRWANEGVQLEGLLTVPVKNAASSPPPLIVFPHGGPHSRSAQGFDFTVQLFAAHGYAVFQPNFRGSSGYGQKFIDADRADFGGGDMRDILTGIDHLVKERLVHSQRQFVFGVSYGGYLTCWLVGHTDRFRAAVAQNAVTDLNAMWALSDLRSWTEWEFGGKPWQVPEAMRRHSPLTHADRVSTPTMILHSREDRRCPLPMGRMFHQTLRARGVPTEMVIYPNEGHGIRRPRHREDVLRRTLEWFAKHDVR